MAPVGCMGAADSLRPLATLLVYRLYICQSLTSATYCPQLTSDDESVLRAGVHDGRVQAIGQAVLEQTGDVPGDEAWLVLVDEAVYCTAVESAVLGWDAGAVAGWCG